MLVVQNSRKPAAIRNAVVDIVANDMSRIDIAVAYVTRGGVDLLVSAIRSQVGAAEYHALPKLLIASLDFGITQPEALKAWQRLPNSEVRVAGADRVMRGSLMPTQAYHPKVYAFTRTTGTCNALVGSANLTSRGWSVNTEAGWTERDLSGAAITSAIAEALVGSVVLTDEILQAYVKLRSRMPRPKALRVETERVSKPSRVAVGGLMPFKEAIATTINPANYDSLWVQGDALQGGSRSQLELPRGGNRFFGFAFTDYAFPRKKTIGQPVLRSGAKEWTDQILSWHGNNRMERMNLPTTTKGGFNYEKSAVMFRRLHDDSFELIVTDWNSDLARSWRQASANTGLLFRLGGRSSNRLVGLL